MSTLVVHPIGKTPLVGSVPVPSDKSIGHRALLLASLCEGTSEIRRFRRGDDDVATADAMRAMGVTIEDTSPTTRKVVGTGLFGLKTPQRDLDCGSSETTMRLLAGVLAAQTFQSRMIGDATLSRRPMMDLVAPLRARGAVIEGTPHPTTKDDLVAPLLVGPLPRGKELAELEHESPVASELVKSALLLSGLYAHGTTWFKESTLSRDHTERMLHALGVPIRAIGTVVELDPAGWSGKMEGFTVDVPGDASAAAFLLVAAQITEGSRVTVRSVGTNPTRTGLLEIARHMGAGLEVVPHGEQAGEPVAEITAWHQASRGILVGGELVSRALDEIPIACALAARGVGETTIRDAEALRVDDGDRLAKMTQVLRAFGVECEELPDGMVIRGTQEPFTPATVDSRGDHRIAMAAAVLGLHGRAPSRITDCDCIATCFPRFVGTLRALGARIDVE